jgi:hypothetical protein
LEKDVRVRRARNVAADGTLLCINETSEQRVGTGEPDAGQAIFGARTLAWQEGWERLGAGTGITVMFRIPSRRGIYGLRQGRVFKLEENDRAWTPVSPENARSGEAVDFTMTPDQDLLFQYSDFEVVLFAAEHEYKKGQPLAAPSGPSMMDVGGGKVVAAPVHGVAPGPPSLWENGRWRSFDGGAVADVGATGVRLDQNGKAAVLRVSATEGFVRAPGTDWVPIAAPQSVLYDDDTGLTYVGTKSGAFYIDGAKLEPLKQGLEFFDIVDIVDLPRGEVLVETREKGYFRVRASEG